MKEQYPSFPKEDIPRCAMIIINQLIGIITIYNNNVMKYITDDIEAGAELLLEEIFRPFVLLMGNDAKLSKAAVK
jgi:hypothetical protein